MSLIYHCIPKYTWSIVWHIGGAQLISVEWTEQILKIDSRNNCVDERILEL